MKKVWAIRSLAQMDEPIMGQAHEWLICLKALSVRGELDIQQLAPILQRAKEKSIRPVLLWDVLGTEARFQEQVQVAAEALKLDFSAVRLKDYGVLNWALKNTKIPIQQITEIASANSLVYQSLLKYAGERIERFCLGPECDREMIKKFSAIGPTEVLGLGPLLIFSSPRALLSSHFSKDSEGPLQLQGTSEESPHRGFPLLENRHGTFMDHLKDYCLLEHWDDLQNLGVQFVRLDPLARSDLSWFLNWDQKDSTEKNQALKLGSTYYARPWTSGYYYKNKSDVLFSKLKSPSLKKTFVDSHVGEVLDVVKGKFLAISVHTEFPASSFLKFVNPEGDEQEICLDRIWDIQKNPCDQISAGKIFLIPYLKKMPARSQIFSKSPTHNPDLHGEISGPGPVAEFGLGAE